MVEISIYPCFLVLWSIGFIRNASENAKCNSKTHCYFTIPLLYVWSMVPMQDLYIGALIECLAFMFLEVSDTAMEGKHVQSYMFESESELWFVFHHVCSSHFFLLGFQYMTFIDECKGRFNSTFKYSLIITFANHQQEICCEYIWYHHCAVHHRVRGQTEAKEMICTSPQAMQQWAGKAMQFHVSNTHSVIQKPAGDCEKHPD